MLDTQCVYIHSVYTQCVLHTLSLLFIQSWPCSLSSCFLRHQLTHRSTYRSEENATIKFYGNEHLTHECRVEHSMNEGSGQTSLPTAFPTIWDPQRAVIVPARAQHISGQRNKTQSTRNHLRYFATFFRARVSLLTSLTISRPGLVFFFQSLLCSLSFHL